MSLKGTESSQSSESISQFDIRLRPMVPPVTFSAPPHSDSCTPVPAFVSEASQIRGQRALVIQKTKNAPRSAKVRRQAVKGKRSVRVHVELKKVPDRLDGDRALVAAAIEGNPGAWSHLYERFHDRLLSASRVILRRYNADSHLIDEIAARVWYALIKDDFDLLRRYDANRGCRFSTFLSLLAKNETKMFLRSERRRRDRERASSRTLDQIAQLEFDNQSAEEFLLTLTPTERTFYQKVLVHSDEPAEGTSDYSSSNVWQLTRRVKKKLQAFLGT